jgi:7-carboxy-7-deazaguanine synthase
LSNPAQVIDHLHRLRPLRDQRAGTLVVHEIYRSLQGESTYAGLPCVFVRLTACHLRCTYCDTPHAFNQGATFAVDDVLAQALALGDQLVEITGGEPLLQADVLPLMTRLADAGRTVLLETSGSLDIDGVDPRVHIVLDLKTPGSGEEQAMLWNNLDLLKSTDEVKIVVCDRADFDWGVDVVRGRDLTSRCPVLVSPAFGRVAPADLARWVLESGLPLRLQLQLHKLLWGAETRGV